MSRRTLATQFDGFVRSLRNRRPETRGTYQRALREFVRWFELDGEFRFRVDDVRRYKRYLTRKRKLSDVSISTYLTALRRFCEFLVVSRVLASNPARVVEGNKRPQSHSRAILTGEDLAKLITTVRRTDERSYRDYVIIRLMIDCALSEIEIIRADVGDLHTDPPEAFLIVQGKGRTRKDARVTLPAEVLSAIDEYLALRPDRTPSRPLFVSAGNRTRGRRMTTRGIRDRVNRYLEEAGIKQGRLREITPYSLRHTAAVLMAEQGATADEIRARMRLGSVATAMLYINKSQRTESETPIAADDKPDEKPRTTEPEA